DFQTLEDGTVTVRDRDSGEQKRISKDEVTIFIKNSS
ncbi:MAG: His/Gly/Thr/Pro-type tRNA ligase C-terminal domain-containing protein, partial [Patescibacteria group bacterium]